jgi:hypothetical protein
MSTEEQPNDAVEEAKGSAALEAPNNNDPPTIVDQNTDPARSKRPGVTRQGGGMHMMAIPTNANERDHVHQTHGEDSWQARILHIIHSDYVQYLLMGLLLLDVMILFVELYISAEYPPCTIIERDALSCCNITSEEEHHDDDNGGRWLSGGESEPHELCEEGSEFDYAAACDPYKYPAVHTTHIVLRVTTVIILSIFMVELSILMAACGVKKFFTSLFYVLDLVVVSVSLALEIVFLTLDESQVELIVGLLVLSRLWRFVRIGHGIFATTYELSSKEHEHEEKYTAKLETLCKENGIALPHK